MDDLGFGFAVCVSLIDFTDDGSLIRINIKSSVRSNLKAEPRVAAVGQTFFGVDFYSAPYLLRKLGGVILRHALEYAFHQNAGSIVRDILFCGQDTDAVLFQLCFVDRTVVPVSRKTVKLINEDTLKCVFVAVGNHFLELCAVICCAADGAVDIFADHRVPVCCGKFIADLELPFNGLLRLRMAGKAGINYYIHGVSSASYSLFIVYLPRCFLTNVRNSPTHRSAYRAADIRGDARANRDNRLCLYRSHRTS